MDFFIVGAQKAGTTALDRLLRQHHGVQMARKKEVHFFDNEERKWSQPEYADLYKQFDLSVPSVVRGEATPIYSYWPQSLERLAEYNPRAFIILCLRHPAFRAHSHWRMEVKRNADSLPFGQAIRSGRERVAASRNGAHRVFSYVERGFYAPQVKRLFRLFGPDRVLVVRTDHLWTDQRRTLAQVCRFLGIAEIEPQSREYVVSVDTTDMASIDFDDFAYLSALYAPDVAETAQLIKLDLSDWLCPSYSEPMAYAPGMQDGHA